MKYDVIIIGTGLGGLLCGYTLSKHGYKVALFEQHHQLGGCLQVFQRNGYTFDTGMHYLGGLGEGEILHKLFTYFDILKDVELRKLDENRFEKITLGGKEYGYAMGYENFIEQLSQYFPKEREGIRNYIQEIQRIAHASPLYNLQEINQTTFIESDFIKKSVGSFIASFTDDPVLQNILAATNTLYAGYPDKTPVYVHALTLHSYISSAWRLVDGSHTIIESLAKSIENNGGVIYKNCKIEKIICNHTEAVSVLTKWGEQFEAKQFISNIHPANTVDLIESHLIRNAYRTRIQNMENTASNMTVYLGFKPNSVPYLNYNHYHFEGDSVWYAQDYKLPEWPKSFLYMMQAREGDGPFANSAQISSYLSFDEVKKWEHTTVGKRGEDYIEFKEGKAEKMIQLLQQHYPEIKENIAYYNISTPLTYRDYTGTKNGSLFGIQRDCNFPVQTLVSQRTKIPNLFLTGQNINSHGFLGVSIGSIITCAEFLGVNTIMNDIQKSSE
ncbi:MAG: NAD(P)/FAD-dependent oxidoreductase [Bacteroidales bacterium]|jgi:all-trans-retinol 13,14-reductase|nr:NAD(P)/FAD-dependent oxidoreductase [Bacteroidales bacterium]